MDDFGGDASGEPASANRDGSHNPLRVLIACSAAKAGRLAADFRTLGFEASTAIPDVDAILRAHNIPAELVAIDVSEDESHRLQWCRSFRDNVSASTIPLIALTDPNRHALRLELLAAGVDDCLADPVVTREAQLRIHAVLRRAALPAHSAGELRYADIVLDPVQLKVWRHGVRVPLTLLPFQLLRLMMLNPGKVYSRAELRTLVWHNAPVEDVTITQCISRLRRSLNAAGGDDLIRRTRNGGYALDADQPASPAIGYSHH